MNKIGEFYRLQSYKNDNEPELISWYMNDSTSSENEMKQDIYFWWKEESAFYNARIKELEQGVPVDRVWEEFVAFGYKPQDWQELIYSEGLEQFLNYLEETASLEDWANDQYYIQVFKGEVVNENPFGAKHIRFIEVINEIDFYRIAEIRERFTDRGYEFGLLDIEELLEISDGDIEEIADDMDYSYAIEDEHT